MTVVKLITLGVLSVLTFEMTGSVLLAVEAS